MAMQRRRWLELAGALTAGMAAARVAAAQAKPD